MPLTKVIPVPVDSGGESSNLEDRRIWIGNLDPRITEYQLLKILEKHGRMEKFDLLFHRSGPLSGQPRGYAFVTYATREQAETMKDDMDGKKIGSKNIIVRWAYNMSKEECVKHKVDLEIPALAGAKEEKKLSRSTKIQAIEAKLKMMETSANNDFQILDKPGGSCGISFYNLQREQSSNKIGNKKVNKPKYNMNRTQFYNKSHHRR